MKQTKLLYQSFCFPILMQFHIQHEKKITLSMIHSHVKFKVFKNVLDFGKFPMLLHSFISQVRRWVRKTSSSKDFYHEQERNPRVQGGLAQHGLQWQNSICNAAWGWGGGKRMGKSEETQDVQETPAGWISAIFPQLWSYRRGRRATPMHRLQTSETFRQGTGGGTRVTDLGLSYYL